MPTPIPEHCPFCGNPTVVKQDPTSNIQTLWCQNLLCPGVLKETLVYVGSRDVLDIDQLGPEIAEILVGGGYVSNLADLFEFLGDFQQGMARNAEKFTAMLQRKGFPVANTLKLMESLEATKTKYPFERWFQALCIPGIGKELGKQLTAALDLTTLATLPQQLFTLPSLGLGGIGEVRLEGILAWAANQGNLEICQRLHEAGCHPQITAKRVVPQGGLPLSGMAICVTGDHGLWEREEIQNHLRGLGVDVKTSVTKKCTHLVAGVGAGPAKLTKARELGVIILTTDWLKTTFKQYGIGSDTSGFDIASLQDVNEL